MTLRFRTIDEAKKQYTETQLLEMVTRYLDNKEYRTNYNHTRNMIAATVKANPEMLKQVLETIKTA